MKSSEIAEICRQLRQSRLGSPRHGSTLGQILATIRDHGGCIIEYENYERRIVRVYLGSAVERTPDTLIVANYRTY